MHSNGCFSLLFNSFVTFLQFYSWYSRDRYEYTYVVIVCAPACTKQQCTQIKIKFPKIHINWLAKKYEMQLCETIKPAAKWKNPFSLSLSLAGAFDCFFDCCLYSILNVWLNDGAHANRQLIVLLQFLWFH